MHNKYIVFEAKSDDQVFTGCYPVGSVSSSRLKNYDILFVSDTNISDRIKSYNNAYAEKYQELQDFRRELIQRAEREFGAE